MCELVERVHELETQCARRPDDSNLRERLLDATLALLEDRIERVDRGVRKIKEALDGQQSGLAGARSPHHPPV